MKARSSKVIRLIFAWFDIWVGVYIDRGNREVYIFPVPMFGVVVKYAALRNRMRRAVTRAKNLIIKPPPEEPRPPGPPDPPPGGPMRRWG